MDGARLGSRAGNRADSVWRTDGGGPGPRVPVFVASHTITRSRSGREDLYRRFPGAASRYLAGSSSPWRRWIAELQLRP